MLYQKRIKNTQRKKQKTYQLLVLITLAILFIHQHLAYSEQLRHCGQ